MASCPSPEAPSAASAQDARQEAAAKRCQSFSSHDLLGGRARTGVARPSHERRASLQTLISLNLQISKSPQCDLLDRPRKPGKNSPALRHQPRPRCRRAYAQTPGFDLPGWSQARRLVEVEDRPYTIGAGAHLRAAAGGASLYTDYTFALWESGVVPTSPRPYSGLTDEEIRQVDTFCAAQYARRFGPVRSVTPQLVFSVPLEHPDLGASQIRCGGALRILRWRHDKRIEDADTLETLKGMIAAGEGD